MQCHFQFVQQTCQKYKEITDHQLAKSLSSLSTSLEWATSCWCNTFI